MPDDLTIETENDDADAEEVPVVADPPEDAPVNDPIESEEAGQ